MVNLHEIKLSKEDCHVCGEHYDKFQIGSRHVYATCLKCNRKDEVGYVLGDGKIGGRTLAECFCPCHFNWPGEYHIFGVCCDSPEKEKLKRSVFG